MNVAARDRRALRIGFTAIAALVLLSKGWPALRRAEFAARERESQLLSQASDIGREAVATLEAAQTVSELGPDERYQLASSAFDAGNLTELLATATRYVSGVAAAVGVTVHSAEPSVDSTWVRAGQRVVLDIGVSSVGSDLLRLIDELSSGPRLCVIERMEIRVRSTEVGPSELESLSVTLRVVAFGTIREEHRP